MFELTDFFKGIKFLLGAQLIIVAIIHFVVKSKPVRIPLAFLCLILGLWFFKYVFMGHWKEDLILFILIGPGKPIFAGAILLFYYRSVYDTLQRSFVLKNLIAPTVFYLMIIGTRFFGRDTFYEEKFKLSVVFGVMIFFIYLYYFIVSKKEIETRIKPRIIPRAYKRVLLLFYTFYFFLLQVPIWDLYVNILKANIFSEAITAKMQGIYESFVQYGEMSIYVYLHLLGYFLFLFALSEIPYFKKAFLPKNALINEKAYNSRDTIDALINERLVKGKLFKDSTLTLESCSREMGISKRDLFDHIKHTRNLGFKEFINLLRVEEIKSLMAVDTLNKYDLVGLAKECGFKSKSTFYRVFKEIEGLPPNEFKKLNYNL